MEISSIQNNKIKNLIKLSEKSRDRKREGLFVVEGIQENRLALKNDFEPVQFFVQEEIFQAQLQLPYKEYYAVSRQVYDKIAYRSTTGGIVGVYKSKSFKLADLKLKENLLLTVLEAVEKPGNLGAVLRSADASASSAVVICDSKVDFYNPNVIRSSVGTVFTNTLISCGKEELTDFCKVNQIQILATYLRPDTVNLFDSDLKIPTAIVFGTESDGLSDFWAEKADQTIKIPMLGQVDSLNVSNAVAVCLFEAVRQRSLK